MIADVISGKVDFEIVYRDELLRQYVYWILRTAASPGRSKEKIYELQKYIAHIPASYNIETFENKLKINALKKSPEAYLRIEKGFNAAAAEKKALKNIMQR